ncbi:phosphoethanolamine transferase [Pseudomonas bharatica]|uniref:phosphoethanolamine transferase n=1 Tax=Pseudomonas bharatica TaxID=2692112 RepID=UPI003B2897D7
MNVQASSTRGMPAPLLVLLVALWMTLVMNAPFWRKVWTATGGLENDNSFFLGTLPLLVLAFNFVVLCLLAWGRLGKLVLVVMLLLSACVSYFMSNYGVMIDYSMLINAMQTDRREVFDLLGSGLAFWVLLVGVVPAIVVSRIPLARPGYARAGLFKAGSVLLALALIALILALAYQSYASLLRNHRELRLMLVPSNLVGALHSYAKRQLRTPLTLEPVGLDAALQVNSATAGRHKVVVLVVGETARAASFSLNGYERQTNPALAAREVVSFSEVSACGTATAISVPCMFQDLGRREYRSIHAKSRENLLDVLQRAGVAVLWRDNNSGCKGACDRVPSEEVDKLHIPGICTTDGCFDEALLHGLAERIDSSSDDTLIVLHMLGSHGPAYYKRYPQAFRRFTPTCDSSQLDKCDNAAIVNAYDNSILYTDHVLGQLLDLLKARAQRFDTAMLYVSDHGESLGEKGVYLHGLPYAMAPSEQIRVPMVAWLSEGFARSGGASMECLRGRRDSALSHDNLFHSMLGLMGVSTSVYREELDLFRPCGAGPGQVAAAAANDAVRSAP